MNKFRWLGVLFALSPWFIFPFHDFLGSLSVALLCSISLAMIFILMTLDFRTFVKSDCEVRDTK